VAYVEKPVSEKVSKNVFELIDSIRLKIVMMLIE
jgi:hypothetical protein